MVVGLILQQGPPLANSCLGVYIERGGSLHSLYCADFVIYASSKSCSTFGTKKFQGGNSLVPAEELFSSKGGTFRFLGRKIKFPAEELLGGRALGREFRVNKWK